MSNGIQHTQGKWKYAFDDETKSGLKVYTDDEMISDFVGGKNLAEAEANARLISAAPDLLACLENLNQAIDNYWNSTTKPDSLVKLINKHQQISADVIKKAAHAA